MKIEIKPLKKKIAILISGKGTNMEAIIKDSKTINYPGIVKFVLSNNPDALGIIKAKNLGIKTFVFPVNKNHSMEIFEKRLLNLLIKEKIELICLAGFMKILPTYFIKSYTGKIVNIHPSLLPKYKGLNTHKRVIMNNEKFTGCTIHYVNRFLDSGKIIIQKKVRITKKDTNKSIEKKVLKIEHSIYPKTIDKILSTL